MKDLLQCPPIYSKILVVRLYERQHLWGKGGGIYAGDICESN